MKAGGSSGPSPNTFVVCCASRTERHLKYPQCRKASRRSPLSATGKPGG
jgi:hypothetical protein